MIVWQHLVTVTQQISILVTSGQEKPGTKNHECVKLRRLCVSLLMSIIRRRRTSLFSLFFTTIDNSLLDKIY